MELTTVMSGNELAKIRSQAESLNKSLNAERQVQKDLGKDDFLKILINQLTNQDPLEPMEDKEFVAQMAQFSTLEQMTNLSGEFGKVQQLILSGQALALLGRTVELMVGDQVVTGKVMEVIQGESPQILVNGQYFDYSQVEKIIEPEKEAAL